jgi:hypothetical protein
LHPQYLSSIAFPDTSSLLYLSLPLRAVLLVGFGELAGRLRVFLRRGPRR